LTVKVLRVRRRPKALCGLLNTLIFI
jgi:hypothetical protein